MCLVCGRLSFAWLWTRRTSRLKSAVERSVVLYRRISTSFWLCKMYFVCFFTCEDIHVSVGFIVAPFSEAGVVYTPYSEAKGTGGSLYVFVLYTCACIYILRKIATSLIPFFSQPHIYLSKLNTYPSTFTVRDSIHSPSLSSLCIGSGLSGSRFHMAVFCHRRRRRLGGRCLVMDAGYVDMRAVGRVL